MQYQEPRLAKVLRWLIFATALVPLVIFSQFISPFHFGKVVVFRSLIELLVAGYIVLAWRDSSYRPKGSPMLWAFLAFAGAFTVTTIASPYPYISFWGTLERMGGLWTFWHYFAYFVMLVSVLKTREHWMRLLNLTIAVGILSAIYGFFQKTDISFFVGSGGRERIFGTIGNAALFAGYQILTLFLALTFLMLPGNSSGKKRFYAIAAALNVIAIFMTAVRGSLLATVVGLLLFLWLASRKFRLRNITLAFRWLVVLGVLFFGFVLLFKDSSFVQHSRYLRRVTDVSPNTYTVQTRFWAWQAGLEGWSQDAKKITLGWGPENFNIPFSLHFNPKFYNGPGSETLFDRAHNMFVEVLVTMGIVGFAAYVFLFVALFMALSRLRKREDSDALIGMGFVPLVVAYIIHNSFIFDTSANFIVFFAVLAFVAHRLKSGGTAEPVPAMHQVRPSAVPSIVGVILLAGAVVLLWQTNVTSARANYATTRAIVRGWAGDYRGAVQQYKTALAYDVPGEYDYRHRYAQYVLEQTSSGSLDDAQKNDLLYGIEQVQKNINPDVDLDYLPYLYISRMYITLGRTEGPDSEYNTRALENSTHALRIAPRFVRTYFEIAQAYLNQKNYQKAIEYFQQAADLNPDVGISYWYLGVVQMQTGDREHGLASLERAVEKGYDLEENDYLRLIGVYISLNDFPKIVSLYEGVVRLKPDNAEYRSSLAAAYARVGRVDDAVAQAREAVRINPAFETEARAFIEGLGRSW